MITLDQVKNVLRIDTDEDDTYLDLIMKAAVEYITAAIGEYPEKARADILALFLVSTMYENRTFAVSTKDEKKQHIISGMILQLQLEAPDVNT